MAKPIKMADLRGKSDEELATYLKSAQKELLDTRFQNYTNTLVDSSRIATLRRDVARALTVKNERAAKAEKKA